MDVPGTFAIAHAFAQMIDEDKLRGGNPEPQRQEPPAQPPAEAQPVAEEGWVWPFSWLDGQLDAALAWSGEQAGWMASTVGDYASYAAMCWLGLSLLVVALDKENGPQTLWDFHRPILLGVGFVSLWALWAPVRLAGRASGRDVPSLSWGSVARFLGGAATPHVREPETAELAKRRTVDPQKAKGTERLSNGQIWTPVGVRPAVSAVIAAESGAAKGQTHVNYAIQYQMLHSPEHLVLLEVKPNLELSRIAYANEQPGDRIYEYTMQTKDGLSSAFALLSNPRTLADVCWMLANDPDQRQDGHWDEKAADCIEQAALGLRGLGLAATVNDVRDVVADRERLADLRRRCPALDYVADEPKEWGFIRSTAAKRLKPLSDPMVRRVFAGQDGVPQPDFARTDGREIVIVRPDWSSAERTSRLVTALVHALIMGAVVGGYAGGPGTQVILDEAGSFMRLSRLGSYLELARGGSLNLLYVLQSRAQLAAQLGREEAERVWDATELKIVGPTGDLALARDIAALSGERRVRYAGPRRHDEYVGQTREHVRNVVAQAEVTGQQEAEFTLIHRGRVEKYRVHKRRYHHTQAAEPPAKRPRPLGVADPESYRIPPMHGTQGDERPNATEDDWLA